MLNMTNYPNGLYILKIETGSQVFTHKVVVNKY
ncbi:MAG: T9SS type A sorting domain-containing protein [Bacteroidales bacterium]|nr:T9SS type A sorting domain-containing protein [Bacteroidales bacterium]